MTTYLARSCIIIALAGSMFLTSCSQTNPDQSTSTNEADKLLRKQVPVGSTPQQVIAFLDSCKTEHSAYDQNKRNVTALIRNTSEGFMIKGSLQVDFRFDDQSRLINHSIKEVFTAP